MSEKTKAAIFSLLIIVVIGAVAWAVAFKFFDIEPTEPIAREPTPVVSTEPGPGLVGSNSSIATTSTETRRTYKVKGEDGRVIAVRDFTESALQDKNNKEVKYLAGEDENGFIEDALYVISFFSEDDSFTISLFAQPIGATRKRAESELLSKLGIEQADACLLRYVVLVPFDVDKNYSGRNLGFSFCPGAVQLP